MMLTAVLHSSVDRSRQHLVMEENAGDYSWYNYHFLANDPNAL